MSVTLIRHADLEPPYNNYDKLSLDELDLLATEKIQPHINEKLTKSKIQQHIKNGFFNKGGIDAVYYSPSIRAHETAKLLAAALGINEMKELEYLKEIAFSPKKLITEKNFKLTKMNGVRNAVYSAVEQGKTDESIQELIARVYNVQRLIADNRSKNTIIVTHGFLLRLLQTALLGEKLKFTIKDQEQAINYGYLEGFSFTSKQAKATCEYLQVEEKC